MAIVKASDDWWALWVGLLVFALSLFTLAGAELLGWGVTTQVWLSPAKALAPVSKAYAALPGVASLALTYLFLLAVMTAGAARLGLDAKRFAAGFSVILWASWLCWLAGNNAYVAATPDKRGGFGIGWSLSLTGEAGYIVALAAGLAIGNFLPGGGRHGLVAGGALRGGGAGGPALRRAGLPRAPAARRRGVDGARRQDRRRGDGERRHHRGARARQGRGGRRRLAGRLDADDDHHGQGLHRHVHRRVGLRARAGVGVRHPQGRGADRLGTRHLGALPEVRARLLRHLRGPARARGRAARAARRGQARHRRDQRLSRALLRDDVLHHRPGLELREAAPGGPRAPGARLRRVPVRVHRLDRPRRVVDLLPRHGAPAGELRCARTSRTSRSSPPR